jgi:hypothetical protein
MAEVRLSASGQYSVLVIDMYHYTAEEDLLVSGFPTLALATEYARRRTRDSLEELRGAAQTNADLRKQWFIFGEDCIVVGGEYKGSAEIEYFIEHHTTPEKRDWKAIEKLVREGRSG